MAIYDFDYGLQGQVLQRKIRVAFSLLASDWVECYVRPLCSAHPLALKGESFVVCLHQGANGGLVSMLWLWTESPGTHSADG